MKILISGGLGFIGGNLVKSLSGNEITIIDNLYNSSIHTASDFKKQGINVLIEDIRRKKCASKEFDIVFHLAAHTSVVHAQEDPMFDASNNILGTISIVKNYPTKKFVYLSSGYVYGDSMGKTEDDRPEATSPYGISKLLGEAYVRMFCKNYLILRLANIYGPGAEGKSECAVLEHFKNDNPLTIFGDGSQTRDFLLVEDLIKIIKTLIEKDIKGTVNVGTGFPTTIKSLAEKMANGRKIIYKNKRNGEYKNSVMNCGKLKSIINFTLKNI